MVHDFVKSGEFAAIFLAVLIVLVALAVTALVLRNRTIGRGQAAYLVSVHYGGRHRMGQAIVSTSDVRWYMMRSVSLRPTYVWRRGDLELGPPRPLAARRSPYLTDPVRVSARMGEEDFEITMNNADYAALRSWSESAPPGIHADVA